MASHSAFRIRTNHEAPVSSSLPSAAENCPSGSPLFPVRSGGCSLLAYHHPVCKQPDQTQHGAHRWEAVAPYVLHDDNEEKDLSDGLPATAVRQEIIARAALTLADARKLREDLDGLETKLGSLASVGASIRSEAGCQPLGAVSLFGVALSQSPLNAVACSQECGSTMCEEVASEYSA